MAMYGTAAAERRKAREARLVEIRKRQGIADELMADEAKHRASALGAWSRLEERAAKMMGYDEPEQVEQTVTTVPADLMALVQQARALEGPFGPGAIDQRLAAEHAGGLITAKEGNARMKAQAERAQAAAKAHFEARSRCVCGLPDCVTCGLGGASQ